MEIIPAVNTIRHLAHCARLGQQFGLHASGSLTRARFLKDSYQNPVSHSLCSLSTVSNNGIRTANIQKPSCKAGYFQSQTSVPPLVCEVSSMVGCLGSVRGMAGHSKWSNIKHTKAAKDGEKARTSNDYSRKLRSFMRETGQTDPKLSSQLARLINEARSKNVPGATIDRVISQMISLKNASPMIFAAKGPAGSVMIIEALSTKAKATRAELQGIVKKCGFSINDSGTLAQMVFEEKGIVQVSCPGEATATPPDLESYVDIAIEAGAEDVTLEDDEEGNKVLQFVCEPVEMYAVKKELEARKLEVSSAETMFTPTTMVTLDPGMLELIAKSMGKLDEHPDVLRVFLNVQEPATAS